MNTTLVLSLVAGLIGLIGLSARIYFYYQGKIDQRQTLELEQAREDLSDVAEKKKRDQLLADNPSLADRVRNYRKNKG